MGAGNLQLAGNFLGAEGVDVMAVMVRVSRKGGEAQAQGSAHSGGQGFLGSFQLHGEHPLGLNCRFCSAPQGIAKTFYAYAASLAFLMTSSATLPGQGA